MPDNPYPVLGVEVPPLLGRTSLVKQIEAHLNKSQPDHIYVVGPPRYGKRVLLHEISRRYASGRDGYTTSAYINLRDATPETDREVMGRFADGLRHALHEVRPDIVEYLDLDDVPLVERLQLMVEELGRRGDRLLLIADGFDRVLTNPGITREFWDNLRQLARRPVLRFVMGSRRLLRELCGDDSKTSDLWELFHDAPVIVGRFADDDWAELVAPLASEGIRLDPQALAALDRWTGGIPVVTLAFLQSLYEATEAGSVVTVEDVDRVAGVVFEQRFELLSALWDDLTAELKTHLSDLTGRDLRVSELTDLELLEMELRGLVRKEGKKVRFASRLLERVVTSEAPQVNSMQRLFGRHAEFEKNVRTLLEMRLDQLPRADDALHGYVQQAIRHVAPEPRHSLVWVRSIVDRALDVVWRTEFGDGVTLPAGWLDEWSRAGIQNPPDDGHGRLPAERGRQVGLLRIATGTGHRGQSVRRVTRKVSRPTAVMIEHLQGVGNFGQHMDDTVRRPFAVAVCLSAIALCDSLASDLGIHPDPGECQPDPPAA